MKIKDIAKLANVSTSAVSLALNGKPGISDATREKILKITQEHGYMPKNLIKTTPIHPVSSKLLRFVACTNAGIVTEQYESLPFFMELIRKIDENIRSRGFSLTITSIAIDSLITEITSLEQKEPSSGIILLGTNLNKEQIQVISNIQPNLVVIDTCFETLDTDFIVMNNVKGAYDACNYLINHGHDKIGYVQSSTRFYNFNMRRNGFYKALKENDLSIKYQHIFTISPTDVQPQADFKQAITKLADDLPTALFCECDYMAISVIKSLTDLGITIPEQVSVIGFDNIWESRIIHPELTTIDVRKDKIAALAVEKLIKNIEDPNTEKRKVYIDTGIIERKSCK